MTKKVTNEDLARMMQDGFMEMDKKIDGVDEKVDSLDKKVDSVCTELKEEIQEVNTKVDKVHDTLIHYMDYQSSRNEEFDARITKLETAILEKAHVN